MLLLYVVIYKNKTSMNNKRIKGSLNVPSHVSILMSVFSKLDKMDDDDDRLATFRPFTR